MHMKKNVLWLLCSLVLLTGCGTYTGQGAATGGTFGAILGSAIGGISGGRHGSNLGTVIGMAGGAAVGAAVGSAADQRVAERTAEYRQERARRAAAAGYDGAYGGGNYGGSAGGYGSGNYGGSAGGYEGGQGSSDSGYDASGRGDDRIDFDAPGPRDGRGTYSAATPRVYTPTSEPGYHVHYNALIEIRNARVIDANHDGVLRAGEECKVTFEIMNNSSQVLYDVQPTVFDVTGNKHIHISPNLHVESIDPHSGIRYTASILADRKLKDGSIVIRVGVAQGNREITSQMQEFTVRTSRK